VVRIGFGFQVFVGYFGYTLYSPLVGNDDKLALEVACVRLEAIILPHFDGGSGYSFWLRGGGILGEERFRYFFQNRGANVAAGNRTNTRPHLSGWTEMLGTWSIAEVDHYLIAEVSDVLSWVAHSGVVVKGQS